MCVVWWASSRSARERITEIQRSDKVAASRKPRARSMRVSDAAMALVMEKRGAKLMSVAAGLAGGLRVNARIVGPAARSPGVRRETPTAG